MYKEYNKLLLNYSLAIRKINEVLSKKEYINIQNLTDKHLGWFVSLLGNKKTIVITEDQIMARKLYEDFNDWELKNALLPCSWSQVGREEIDYLSNYLAVFKQTGRGLLVASMEEWNGGWSYKYGDELRLFSGQEYNFNELAKKMVEIGYARVNKCTHAGEFSQIGDVWLIWPIGREKVWRCEFDGRKLEKIWEIDLETGELEKEWSEIAISPEIVSNEDDDGQVQDLAFNLNPDYVFLIGLEENEVSKIKRKFSGAKIVILNNFDNADNKEKIVWPVQAWAMANSGQEFLTNSLKKYRLKKNIVVTSYPEEFRKWIHDLGLDYSKFEIKEGNMACGGLISEEGLGIWSDKELFGLSSRKIQNSKPAKVNFRKLLELKVGELVVHADHGIGLLKDFTTRAIGEIKKDYLVIAYNGGDLLYVPVEQLNKISKYIGSKLIRLNRLGSNLWNKRKRRVQKQVEAMAKELLKVYAKRKLIHRKPYKNTIGLEQSLEDGFDYDLTEDQKLALREINDDLSRDFPMDRLLCGDVGFGKTELAIRAAARAVKSGKQVAIMVPTTILAEQHLVTFRNRLNSLKIKIDAVSRLRDKEYQKQVLINLKNGMTDILIGTHRLLQADVVFKDLGLLIIDEEQKFGVRAKEKLKRIRQDVDVLSMSATPIPRTLNMSMGGVRDLSVLEVAPEGRRSIYTEVIPFSEGIIKEVVDRELKRGGQVFIVHNRVRTIEEFAKNLRDILGKDSRIGIAHGKMSERDLVDAMSSFAKGEFDILLATTIVENGLDLPNVNSLIVENAAGLGLAQLYQLRGRVGRSSRKAYAYFLYRSEKLKSKARQRLDAIAQATELGSGMKLAVADMEIRGVGNVLGLQQHGNAYAVGLGMFLDMLSDMVRRLKNENEREEMLIQDDVVIDLPVSATIPSYYVSSKEDRLYWEHRLSVQSDIDSVDKVSKEMVSQFGAMPLEVENLIKIIKIRLVAGAVGIFQINTKKVAQGLSREAIYLCVNFKEDISLDWVQYLFKQASSWLFKDREAQMEVLPGRELEWFDWFYKLIINYQKSI